jgi:hypothetical protein
MIQTGFTPDHPGMLPLVDGDKLIALLTWTEAIQLGTLLLAFGAHEGARAGAPETLVRETYEAARDTAAQATEEVGALIAGGEA